MTTLGLTVHAARLNLAVWRYLARRAVLRLMRRAADWLAPVG